MFRNLLITFLLAMTFAIVMAQIRQCTYQPCEGQMHTMCKFPYTQPAKRCNYVKSVSLSNNDKQEILNLHNKLRHKVASGQERRGNGGPQPPGFIPPLKWDTELEEVALRWAKQCDYGHDGCRDVGRFEVGQNIAWEGSSNPNAMFKHSVMILDWYDEVTLFDPRQIHSFKFDPEIAHYTQMVWGDTLFLGCAAVQYISKEWNSNIYFVCNYGPTGNIIDEPIYKIRRRSNRRKPSLVRRIVSPIQPILPIQPAIRNTINRPNSMCESGRVNNGTSDCSPPVNTPSILRPLSRLSG